MLKSGVWVIRKLRARIPQDSFEVSINGRSMGMTKLLAVARRLPDSERVPQVLVLYASGYLRLKTGADPTPPLPFGQSLVLGPAIWVSSSAFPDPTLFFHPQLQRVAIEASPTDEDGTPGLVIRVTAANAKLSPGSTVTNRIMDLAWTLTLEQVSDRTSTLAVAGRFEFTEEVIPDPGKTAEAQSLRLLQISTMFIDRRRHDVDALRWRTTEGVMTACYTPDLAQGLLPAVPSWLDPETPRFDSLQTDAAAAPNGPTPSYRVMIDATTGPLSGPLAVRAFLNRSRKQSDDNLGLWVFQQPSARIARGTTGSIDYRVIAGSV
ncbi:MAG TPA: hypothetical protein VES73_04325 [Lamprocystis sp. (in: g-proteobacteria)]|nr:hypothetical protein [Lamprocystis sp. (in: g-proteobacteria)]